MTSYTPALSKEDAKQAVARIIKDMSSEFHFFHSEHTKPTSNFCMQSTARSMFYVIKTHTRELDGLFAALLKPKVIL